MFGIPFEIRWNALWHETLDIKYDFWYWIWKLITWNFIILPYVHVKRLISPQFISVNGEFVEFITLLFAILFKILHFLTIFARKLFYSIIWSLNHIRAIAMPKNRNKKFVSNSFFFIFFIIWIVWIKITMRWHKIHLFLSILMFFCEWIFKFQWQIAVRC